MVSVSLSRSKLNLLLLLALLPALTGCGRIFASYSDVGVLSAAASNSASETGLASIAQEQNEGIGQARTAKNNHLKLDYALENDPHSEVQVLIRNLAQDPFNPVIAILGATSNDATMQIAGLVNFFNVPMLIPTADGNALLPVDNLWAFRLSAPSSAYASYLFTQVLNQTNLGGSTGSGVTTVGLSLAILYEQNTFGEAAAVATAEAAMAQGISIADYASFPATSPSIEQLNTLAQGARDQGASLIYLIASDPATAESLVGTLRSSFAANNSPMPVLLGQAGAFTSDSFLGSAEAEGVYVLRQRWNKTNCPAQLTSYYAAQSYGAAYLLNNAVGLTNNALAASRKWYTRVNAADELAKFRQALRDQLKATNTDVPCLGSVAFDPTGQNKSLEFEVVTLKNGAPTVVSSNDFLKQVVDFMLEMNIAQ